MGLVLYLLKTYQMAFLTHSESNLKKSHNFHRDIVYHVVYLLMMIKTYDQQPRKLLRLLWP